MAPLIKKDPRGPFADKLWRDALRKAVLERIEGDQKLTLIARRVVADALDGNDRAYKEIGDRLDGKPAQALEHSGDITLSIANSLALIRQREEQDDAA